MIYKALTIAGSDSGGGAGIQADLKTFSRLRVFGMSAITALTAQNTSGVTGVVDVDPGFVKLQIDTVLGDLPADAAKTGMLSSVPIIEAVADRLRAHRIGNLVVDPVMVAKSGAPLLRPDAVDALVRELLPLACVLTPNTEEASVLTGRRIQTLDAMADAARALHQSGCRFVLVKGGHLEGEAVDVFFDGTAVVHLPAPRIPTSDTHGTGCVLSAAITAYLARGEDVAAAVRMGKKFVTEAIRNSLRIGSGHGPCDPLGLDADSPL